MVSATMPKKKAAADRLRLQLSLVVSRSMIDAKSVNGKLRGLSKMLCRGSLNYAASFGIWEVNDLAGESFETIIRGALGNCAVLGGFFEVSPNKAVQSIRNGFLYRGDDGAYPGKNALNSIKFATKVTEVMFEIDTWVTGASQIIGFWLKEGHPFYPVFWEYAYIIESESNCHVFVGSSSD